MTPLEDAIKQLFIIAVLAFIGLLLGLGSYDGLSAYLRYRRRKKEDAGEPPTGEEG